MSSVRFQRRVYCAILRLHRKPFRERFYSEMLWIYDEMVGDVGMPRLGLDALRSVWKQRMADDTVPRFVPGPFQTLPVSFLSLGKLAQATVLACLAVLGFFALLQMPVSLPQQERTFPVRRAGFDPCGEYKAEHHARSR